jgi:hypothetical protein
VQHRKEQRGPEREATQGIATERAVFPSDRAELASHVLFLEVGVDRRAAFRGDRSYHKCARAPVARWRCADLVMG